MSGDERSPAGSPNHRHRRTSAELQPASGDWPHGDALRNHLRAHLGPAENVWHEVVSEFVHIDVHIHEPTPQCPALVLVTEGMSRLPMTVPKERSDRRWAELVLCLPRDWPLGPEDIKDARNYWPLRWLYTLARLPHQYGTWLGFGHTIPNGDPPRPFASDTELCCWLLTPPAIFAKGFGHVPLASGETLHLYTPIPIHRSEIEFKQKRGAEPLIERLWQAKGLGVLDVRRRAVC